MDINKLAGRNLRAQKRIVAAAEALGTQFDLDAQVGAVVNVRAKNRDAKRLFQMEAIATLLEDLAAATGAVLPSEETAEPADEANTGDETNEPDSTEDDDAAAEKSDSKPSGRKVAKSSKGSAKHNLKHK